MEYTKLGRIRPVYKGTWSASTAYTTLDIVKNSSGDRAYIAVKDVPKGTALTDTAHWAPVLDVSAVLNAADAAIDSAVARADAAAASANAAAQLAYKGLKLTEKANPAIVWPEEGSLLRPKITMLPMQGGSGDPYPAGAGKNLFDKNNYTPLMLYIDYEARKYVSYTDERTVVIPIKPNTTYTVKKSTSTTLRLATSVEYPVSGGTITNRQRYDDDGKRTEPLTITSGANDKWLAVQLFADSSKDTEYYGIPANIEDLQVEEGSTATDYMPFSNIRPISGRTAVAMARCGKNLFNYIQAETRPALVEITQITNGVRVSPTANDGWTNCRFRTNAPLVVGKKYTLSVNAVSNGANVPGIVLGVCDANLKNPIDSTRVTGTGKLAVTFEIKKTHIAEGNILFINLYGHSGGTSTIGEYCEYTNIQLEVGETVSTYEPYRGDVYSISLGQTVYGGILDAASGTLTVTHKLIALKDRNWDVSGKELGRFLLNIAMKPYVAPICDMLPGKVWNANSGGADLWTLANNNGDQLIVRTSWNIEDNNAARNEWYAWLTANDPQACYELKTPAAVQLSPALISALEGLNTVTSNGEGMELTYNKSLVREHEELLARIAALEAAAVNNT